VLEVVTIAAVIKKKRKEHYGQQWVCNLPLPLLPPPRSRGMQRLPSNGRRDRGEKHKAKAAGEECQREKEKFELAERTEKTTLSNGRYAITRFVQRQEVSDPKGTYNY
jgi:hypothetical protein